MSIRLQDHQSAVLEHFVANKNQRGLLAFHGTGSGKTLTAIAISERFKYFKEVLVIAPKSLHDNFKKELDRFTKRKNDDTHNTTSRYKYISSNASNMIDKLETNEDELTGLDIKSLHSLDNKFIIIDEAHNVLNAMVNGSKNATALYDMLMEARNCKILFLTASGIVNNFYEVIPCLNICKGYIPNIDGVKLTLFPENKEQFIKYFVDESSATLKNVDKFKNRIQGLVSYKGELFDEHIDGFYQMLKKSISKENYPTRLPLKLELVKMSPLQHSAYINARDKERLESSRSAKSDKKGGDDGKWIFLGNPQRNRMGGALTSYKGTGTSTSYRIKSRQIGNVFIPDDNSINIFENISLYSPKIEKIAKRIVKGRKAIVYSNFVAAGIEPMAKYLDTLGFTEYNVGMQNTPGPNGQYAIYSGGAKPEDRTNLLNHFNKDDNDLTVLLITSAGAEGISTKGTRDVHIMEPYWNHERILQVMARAIRYKSHEHLPESERNVQVYLYLADYMDGYKSKEMPTDVHLFKGAVQKYEINMQMTKLLASTSIECFKFNKKYNFDCYKCEPKDGSPIYIPDIEKDMQYVSPCQTLNVKEVSINGELYYVGSDDRIYEKSGNKYLEIVDFDVLNHIRNKLTKLTGA